MDKNMASFMIEILEEQAALIQKQLLRLKDGKYQLEHSSDNTKTETGKNTKKTKAPVDPNRPKRPPSGYQLFMAEQTPAFKVANPTKPQTELMSEIARNWTALDPVKKAIYTANADKLKGVYQDDIKAYDAKTDSTLPSMSAAEPKVAKKVQKKAESSTQNKPLDSSASSSIVEIPSASSNTSDEAEKRNKKKKRKDSEHHQHHDAAEGSESPDKKKKKHKKEKSGDASA